ncbi:hypothetical protein KO02_22715 [Sphingobacterium sp. ML3W]|uniref:hypothetical protein n=1 Tax=Sphingobacterium sp. ML3W TaxID=1538644 RepID=UPI0004F6B58E|nr:hypothetical protein [Sphingobacterium sp. ML3W]AIM39180.1 hypothetical protein KO02_22715 [Sphingobacterium sp. ML3W]
MLILVLIIFLFIGCYYFWAARQRNQRFANHGQMSVSYLFQERPGQYSGDRSIKSGVLVIHSRSHDEKLKHATIKHVHLQHPDLRIHLEQSLALPFQHDEVSKPEVSVRYKVIKNDIDTVDLTGVNTTIAGKLHFVSGASKTFKVTVPISGLYQEQGQN